MNWADIQYVSAPAPAELIATAYHELVDALEGELLDRLRTIPPAFFEAVILDVLVCLGYGRGRREMAQAVGRPNDGGIDGVIRQDALELDIVYLQAKRYAEGRTVGRPEVQSFAGSLDGVGATKGILITTAGFSPAARRYVSSIPKRIALVSGRELVRLMVEHDVGVSTSNVYRIKRVDPSYFERADADFRSPREIVPAFDTVPTCAGEVGTAYARAGDNAGLLRGRSRRPATPRTHRPELRRIVPG